VKEKNAERKDDPLSPEEEPRRSRHRHGRHQPPPLVDRVKDYVFAWDRMLADKGNTGPYLQYAHARTRSIIRKSGESAEQVASGAIVLTGKEERALALALLSFPRTVREVGETLEPHRLCGYLFELASTFSSFFTACPVLKAEPLERASRLALCDLTARVMKQGLGLLGIDAPERM
jgi:arginyl-tRNA synthetase